MKRVFLCILGLIFIGAVIFFSSGIGVSSQTRTDNYTVRVYNVDDVSSVYVNGREVGRVTYTNSSTIDITGYITSGRNTVRLTTENYSESYTYGFEINRNGESIYAFECGLLNNTGCRKSTQSGVVFDKTVTIDHSPKLASNSFYNAVNYNAPMKPSNRVSSSNAAANAMAMAANAASTGSYRNGWETSYSVPLVLNIWDKSGTFEGYSARFQVTDTSTKKIYTVTKEADSSREANVIFPDDFIGDDFSSGTYTWRCYVDGMLVLNEGKFEISRRANTFKLDVIYARWVPLKGKLKGSERTWLQSVSPQAKIGLRNRDSNFGNYPASFSNTFPSGFTSTSSQNGFGADWIYLPNTSDESARANIADGKFRWKIDVRGFSVATGHYDVISKSLESGKSVRRQFTISFQ